MNHFYRAITLVLCFLTLNVMAETPPLKADYFTTCADRTASNTTLCFSGSNQGLNYGGFILLQGYEYHYRLSNGRFVESLDGTARLTGQWINVDDSDIRFDVDIQLSGRTTVKPANSPKEHHCLDPNTNGFYYYTHTSGTLTGKRDVAGARINVARFAEAFQVGIGANVTHNQLTFGASGWLMLTLESQPSTGVHLTLLHGNNGQNGDINMNLSGNPGDCTNNGGEITLNCPNDITVTAEQGQSGASVTYSTPNATTTCMIDNGVNCDAVSSSISGFKYLGIYQGSKYYCSSTSNFTYAQAKALSMQNGGHVAVICSAGENEFLRSSLLADEAWIGLSDELTEGDFRWVNGENCNYTNWNSGEPNNVDTNRDNDHADHTIIRRDNGRWYDRHQSGRYEFIMEIPCQNEMQPGDVTVNRTAGPASGSTFSIGMTTVTYEAVDECGNIATCSFKVIVEEPALPCSGTGFPDVTVEQTNPDCGQANGEIKFFFEDNSGRTHIEFSMDGGNTYPLDVRDTEGMAAFSNLAAGSVDIYVRWGNGECPVDLGIIDLVDGSQAPGTSCDDGNGDTENDVIQADGCSCEGTIIDPCADAGGDFDGDGICFDDDCNDFNASIGAKQTPGTACDDGNPNTINDVIQDDGCGCFGLPRGTISIFCPGDIEATAAMGAGGTVVFYGQPNANSTCVLGGVTISQTGGPATGSVFPVGTTIVTFTVTDNCENVETCSFEVTVVEMVDPCASKGGDADGDGICADDDCNDDDANVGMKMPEGMECNDGNPNTILDAIQADGCTCTGIAPGSISFTCNDDINVVTAPGSGGVEVTYSTPTATTSCAIGGLNVAQTGGPASGAIFPVGVTFVTYTATDACGNTEICSFRVTVVEEGPTGAKVGDFVFRDNNGNGIQDADEPGIENVFILLTNTTTGQIKFMTSGSDGMYMFGDLDPGTYNLKFVGQPGDLVGVAPGQGNDPSKDSDIDPITGITPDFTLGAGEINNDIDAGFRPKNIEPEPCTADAGSLSGGGTVTIVAGEAPVSATPNGDDVVPAGYSKVYVLTSGTELTIQQTNGSPDFTVTAAGKYTIHTLVYDPNTLDLDVIVPGLTTGFDVNSILIQGGGTICGALDVAGVMFMVENPTTGCPGNVNNGGEIGSDEDPVACGPFDPAAITNIASPSGGNGSIEYIWLASTVTCPTELTDQIAGATGESYDPGIISQTTYFVRCSRTIGCTVWIESNCVVKTVDDCNPGGDLDCNDAVVVGEAGKVTISNIAANAKVEISGPSTGWAQDLVCEGDCNSMEMVTGLSAGDYSITIQSFNPYCYNRITVTVTEDGSGNPCDNAGGDTDGDGVCDNVDNCRTMANADQADNDNDGIGNVCDDTPNGETGNPCDNAGGDTDGDGVCDNVDNCRTTANADQADNDNDGIGNVCDDTPNGETGGDLDCNDAVVVGEAGKVTISNIAANAKVEISGPSTGWAQDLVCEGDCNSMEMVTGLSAGDYSITIQSFNPYCYNRVTVTVTEDGSGNPCDNAGGDTDGDGVCDNVDNCRTMANADQADNDNDGIGNVCDDTPNGETGNPCDNAGGDTDGDGVCDNVDNCRTMANADQADNDNDGIGNVCDDTPNGETGGDLDCNDVVVLGEAGKVTISNIAANAKVEISGPSTGWGQDLVCEGDCNSMEMVTGLSAGDYSITIQTFNPYCYNRVTVTVTAGGGGNPCDNAGGDTDGDGVCDNVDNCRTMANADQADNDNDGIGNVCDDTPNGETGNPCDNAGGDSDGDGVCDNIDNCDFTANPDQADNDNDGIGNVCDDTPNGEAGPDCDAVVVTGNPGKLVITNLTAPIVAINILDKNAGYASIYSCFNDCDVPMTMLDLPASDYLVKVEFYSASWVPICRRSIDVTVPGGVDPCADKGGDNDGDGVCRDDDCDDNNANVGARQTAGTSCDDGDATTENDVIQSDGCSCSGTPIGPEKCANRTVSNTQHCSAGVDYGFYIVHRDLEKRYTFHDGLLMEFTDGSAMLTGRITNNGDSEIGFDVNINLTGRTTTSPTGDAKAHNCLDPNLNSYYYYADATGTLMGTGKAAGAVLTIRDHAQAFQLGNGANVTNNALSFGASGWLKIDVQSQPTGDLHLDIYDGNNGQNGDININLSGDGTECPNGASSRNAPTTELVDINGSSIKVFPNPVEESLFVDLKAFAGQSGRIRIMNVYGQLVQELEIVEINTGLTRIDVSKFQNGVYHMTLKLDHAKLVTKKILVSRMY